VCAWSSAAATSRLCRMRRMSVYMRCDMVVSGNSSSVGIGVKR
jgi:hypothetical protein